LSYETTAPPSANTLNAVPPDGTGGVPGGRSMPPAGRNGSSRCQGDNWNTRNPAVLGVTIAGATPSNSNGAVLSNNPPVPSEGDSSQLSYDAPPPLDMSQVGDNSGDTGSVTPTVGMDGDGAGNASAHPARLS
jgi:hypothetical protein